MRPKRAKSPPRNARWRIVDSIGKMDRKTLGLLGGIAVAVLVMAALGARSWISNRGEQGTVIKIGAILPQTGPGAAFAEEITEGIELAVSEINQPGNPRVKVLYEDSKNQPKEAITVYNKLVSTEAPPVVIVALSSVAKALKPLAEPSKTAQVYIAVAIPNITDGEYTFRIYPEASGMAGIMAQDNAARYDPKTSAVIYLNDEFGLVSYQAYKEKFREGGGQVVFAESYELQQTDFRPLISKLKSVSPAPSVIYLCGYGPSYGAVVKQLREQDVQSQLTADMTMGLPNTLEQVGSAAAGIRFVDGFMSKELIDKYRKKFGQDKMPSSYVGYAYDIIRLLHHVAQQKHGEFTVDSVRDGLKHEKSYPGLMGKIKINNDGDSNLEFVVKCIDQNLNPTECDEQRRSRE